MRWRFRARPKLLTLNFYRVIKYTVRRYSGCLNVNDVCILSGVRTPIGSFNGKLAKLTAVELGSKALTAAIEKSHVDKNTIQEFVVGNVFSGGCGQSVAFQIAMSAGLADTVIHYNVNKLSGSGMKAFINGCQLISTDAQELVAVGGVESSSNAPYFLKRRQQSFGNMPLKDCIFHDELIDSYDNVNIINFVDQAAKEYELTRDQLDCYALKSYSRAAMAQNCNLFGEEMIPVCVKKKSGEEEVVNEDEEVKKLDADSFRLLKPETGKDGRVTLGNSSALGDGAAMLILASGKYVQKQNLKPLAKIISYAEASLNRKHLVLALAASIRKALLRANLDICSIHVWEIDEAFPINVLLTSRSLELDIEKINMNGGSISLGHPFGMTGARIIVHLVHTLCPGMLGCASICHATGGASAVVIQKL